MAMQMNNLIKPIIIEAKVPAELIAQGAEARVWECDFLKRRAVVKQRFNKTYRHPVLDETLTAQRLKAEVRCMVRARKLGVVTPVPYHVEMQAASIYMEFVKGSSVKEVFRQPDVPAERVDTILTQIGQAVAQLHDGGLVHGDLTTSNMLLRADDDTLVLIDFGLAYNSTNPEDKAVDLYVMERAFTSAHSEREGLFKAVLQAYKSTSKHHCPVFNRFAEVRMRGRKRTMVG